VPTEQLILRVLLAALLGGLVGLERELRDQAAGLRTHILVTVGSALFTVVSAYGFEGLTAVSGGVPGQVDPSRVAAQIVSGIGFLGAGAIIRHGFSVRGLTTAASLWAVAALGMAVGLGMYVLSLAVAILIVGVLALVRMVENRFIYPRIANRTDLIVRFRPGGFGRLSHLTEALDEARLRVVRLAVEQEEEDRANTVRITLIRPREMTTAQLMRLVGSLPDVADVEVR